MPATPKPLPTDVQTAIDTANKQATEAGTTKSTAFIGSKSGASVVSGSTTTVTGSDCDSGGCTARFVSKTEYYYNLLPMSLLTNAQVNSAFPVKQGTALPSFSLVSAAAQYTQPLAFNLFGLIYWDGYWVIIVLLGVALFFINRRVH
jgi:hypothetical protein